MFLRPTETWKESMVYINIEYLHVLFRFIIARLREEYNKCVELPLYHNIIDWSFSWFCRIRMSPPAHKCTHCGGWSRRRTPPFRGTITLRSNCWSWSSRAPSVYANSLMGILPLRLWVEEDWLVEQQLEHLWETWAYLLQAWVGMEFWVSLHLLLLERLLHPHHHLHLPHHFLQKVRSLRTAREINYVCESCVVCYQLLLLDQEIWDSQNSFDLKDGQGKV